MDGFINLHKPAGPTSHDMVQQVRRTLRLRRVGHGGTLDPLAEGVLPIGVGRATRLLSLFQEGDKVYRARVLLGRSTDTYDAAGEVTAAHPVPDLLHDDLERALEPFRGEIAQSPPPFSAIRREGRRMYQRARAGEEVVLPSRPVRIGRLELLSWERPALTLEIACGGGTYIRSLAHDLGQALGCGAHLAGLVRLRVGPMALEEAVTIEALAADPAAALLPLDLPVRSWPAVYLDEAQAGAVRNGRPVPLADLPGEPPPARARAYGPDGRFLALLRGDPQDRVLRPWRVF